MKICWYINSCCLLDCRIMRSSSGARSTSLMFGFVSVSGLTRYWIAPTIAALHLTNRSPIMLVATLCKPSSPTVCATSVSRSLSPSEAGRCMHAHIMRYSHTVWVPGNTLSCRTYPATHRICSGPTCRGGRDRISSSSTSVCEKY